MKKVIGYVLSGAGLLGLLVSNSEPLKNVVMKSLPEGIAKGLGISLLIISLIVLGGGIIILYFASKGSVKQTKKEVPIYKGKEIIGYRVG